MTYHTPHEQPNHYPTDAVSTSNANRSGIYYTSHDLTICGLCDTGDCLFLILKCLKTSIKPHVFFVVFHFSFLFLPSFC